MHRLQFGLKTLLWLMVVTAAFSAGQQFEKRSLKRDGDAADDADQILARLLAEAPAERKHYEDQSERQRPADSLSVLPPFTPAGIARAEHLVTVRRPRHRIIHIADIRYVSLEDLAADLRDQDPDVTDEAVREEHQRIVAVVGRVQAGQRKLIRWLVQNHGVRVVHLEGLADVDIPAYRFMVRMLGARGVQRIPLEFGAVARCLAAGELDDVAAAEDEAAYAAANPISGEGVDFHGPANSAREAAIVRRLVASGPVSVVVLGGAHDLSEAVRAVGGCEYLRVWVEDLGSD
jgi:hypothetical protein